MAASEIITGVVSSGLAVAVLRTVQQYVDARREHRREVINAPTQTTNTNLQQAQAALVIMNETLKATVARAERSERREAELQQDLARLQEVLDDLRGQLDTASAELRRLASTRDTPH